jgi:hypothetical protein
VSGERFVVLGLARVGSGWFSNVARWSTSAALPIEFVKAMSAEEVRVRLTSGRVHSALVADDDVVGLDHDLIATATHHGCVVLVVSHGERSRHLADPDHVLAPDFERDDLLRALVSNARPIARLDQPGVAAEHGESQDRRFRGRLVTITGPSGAGRSTVAMGLAQELAADTRRAEQVCLADCSLVADQAMLHGASDVVPSVLELAEAHRLGRPSAKEVRAHTWHVVDRHYHLLLGLRQRRDWTSLRPRSFQAALDGLRGAFALVIIDTDDELDGERTTGSIDVEERNAMARTAVGQADLVVVVGQAGVQGLHHLLRAVRDVVEFGVPGSQVLPVLNHAPKSRRRLAQMQRAFGLLLSSSAAAGVCAPLPLQPRRGIDAAVRDAGPLPDGWVTPIARAVAGLLEQPLGPPRATTPPPQLVAVQAGELGQWADQSDPGQELG